MKNLLILILGLTTFQVSAQQGKIIGGSPPRFISRPAVKPDITLYASNNTEADLSALTDSLGGRSMVTLVVTKGAGSVNPTLPVISDTILGTKIKIKVYSTTGVAGVFNNDDGFTSEWNGSNFIPNSNPIIYIGNGKEYTFWPVIDGSLKYWAYSETQADGNGIISALPLADVTINAADHKLVLSRGTISPMLDTYVMAFPTPGDTLVRKGTLPFPRQNWGSRGQATIIGGDFRQDTSKYRGDIDVSVFISTPGIGAGFIEGGDNSYFDVGIGYGVKMFENAPKRVVIGALSQSLGADVVAIGFNTRTKGDATAIGSETKAFTRGVAVGRNAKTLQDLSLALGYASYTNSVNSAAIGNRISTALANRFIYGNGNGSSVPIETATHQFVGKKFMVGLDSSFIHDPVVDTTMFTGKVAIKNGSNYYSFPITSPSITNLAKNIMVWTGTGSAATRAFETITGLIIDGQFTTGTPTLTAFGTGTYNKYVAVVELGAGASANTDIPLPTANAGSFGKTVSLSPRDLNTTYNINVTGAIELGGASTATVQLVRPTEFVCKLVGTAPTTYRWVMMDNTTNDKGSASASTNGSGDVVITHNKNHTNYIVQIQATGTTLGIGYTITTKTATTFTVRAYDTNTKTAIASTTVNFDWQIKE